MVQWNKILLGIFVIFIGLLIPGFLDEIFTIPIGAKLIIDGLTGVSLGIASKRTPYLKVKRGNIAITLPAYKVRDTDVIIGEE